MEKETKKKNNVEKLYALGKLSDVQQRLGGWHFKPEDDSAVQRINNHINNMDALDLTRAWCGWELGDERWANIIVELYTALQK